MRCSHRQLTRRKPSRQRVKRPIFSRTKRAPLSPANRVSRAQARTLRRPQSPEKTRALAKIATPELANFPVSPFGSHSHYSVVTTTTSLTATLRDHNRASSILRRKQLTSSAIREHPSTFVAHRQ